MITFTSKDDLSKLSPNDKALPIIEDLVQRLVEDYVAEGYVYRPEDDGYTILVEPDDADRELTELWPGCRLTNIYWEGISKRGDFYIAVYLANNEYGLCFVIPDAPWVNGEPRRMIEDHLDPSPIDTQEEAI